MSDHYRTLGLQPNASKSDIKNAYFRHAQRYHPDHHAKADAAGRAAAAVCSLVPQGQGRVRGALRRPPPRRLRPHHPLLVVRFGWRLWEPAAWTVRQWLLGVIEWARETTAWNVWRGLLEIERRRHILLHGAKLRVDLETDTDPGPWRRCLLEFDWEREPGAGGAKRRRRFIEFELQLEWQREPGETKRRRSLLEFELEWRRHLLHGVEPRVDLGTGAGAGTGTWQRWRCLLELKWQREPTGTTRRILVEFEWRRRHLLLH
jgi:hypothetical protein